MQKSSFSYDTTLQAGSKALLKTTRDDFYGSEASDYLRTVFKHYQEKLGTGDSYLEARLYSVKAPDKSQRSYLYERGYYNPTTNLFTPGYGRAFRSLVFFGSHDSSAGSLVSSYGVKSIDPIYLIADKSTMAVTILDHRGRMVREESYLYTGGSSFARIGWRNLSYDLEGHVTGLTNSDTTEYTATWSNGTMTSETSATGTVTNYTYDALDRLTGVTVAGATNVVGTIDVPAVTTTYTYDATNRVSKREVKDPNDTSSDAEIIATTYTYDLAGRVTEHKEYSTVTNGSNTGYATAYTYNTNGRENTATHPDGGTITTTVYRDGRIKSLTGDAVVTEQYDYGKNTDGTRYTKVDYGGGTVRYAKSTFDWLGRPTKEELPTTTSNTTFTSDYYYHGTTGQLTKIAETDLADTLFVYNTLGEQVRRGLDVSDNGSLDNSSADSISETAVSITSVGDDRWLQSVESVYAIAANGNPTGTKKEVGKTQVRLTGYSSSSSVVSETKHYDINGNVTVETVAIDRANKKQTVTVDHPDASNNSVTIYGNGRLLKSAPADGTSTIFEYDKWGRRFKVSEGRLGDTTTTFVTGTYLSDKIDRPGPADVEYSYDSDGRLSQIDRVKTPQEGNTAATYITTYQEYNTRGQVTHRWGSATRPIEYAYDDNYGHLKTQKSYRAGSGWESSSDWPSSPGTADTTEWVVDAATGLLKEKVDGLASNTNNVKRTKFEYNARGQLTKRIRPRTSTANTTTTATTQYQYHSETAELTKVDYPSGMTDIDYTYTRLGSVKSVVDSTGTRTFTFGTGDFQVAKQELPSAFYGGTRYLAPTYSTTTGEKGRLTGLQYGTSSDSDSALSVTYGYEGTTGRVSTVGAHSKTMTYAYQANSNLVSTVSSGTTGNYYTMTRVWESNRNLVTSVETKWGTTTKALHHYQYDALNRRTAEYKRGEMFDIYDGSNAVGIGRKYQYDDNTGLTSAIDYLDGGPATNQDPDFEVANLGTAVKGRRFEYAYDNQGNRSTNGTTVNYTSTQETATNERTADYTVNSLNQYSQREVPAYVDVAGAADTTDTVTVEDDDASYTVTRQGGYFYALMDNDGASGGYDNDDNDLAVEVTVSEDDESNEGEVHIAEDAEVFSYDLDGNLTADGLWDYVWDAENQLTSMTMKTGLPTGMTRKRLEFVYDYLGRRVEKKVIDSWTGSSGTTITHLRYVYDGNNLIAELDASGNSVTVLSTYVWGLDLSGTTWGAGGVGGLLMIKDGSKVYFPGYDGNGNVSGLVDSADGSLDAKYEYSAFGESLRVGGTSIADDNPFRFSTKYLDSESGLIYYGFRYYSPSLGRFLNRDPLGELGGSNLYAFVENDPVNGWDRFGLAGSKKCKDPSYEAENGDEICEEEEYVVEEKFVLPDLLGENPHLVGAALYDGSTNTTFDGDFQVTGAGGGGGGASGESQSGEIGEMASRLGSLINDLPVRDLRRLFLITQYSILLKLDNANWTASSEEWLNNVVRDFMNPLFAALEGNPNQRWRDTLEIISRWQETVNVSEGSPEYPFVYPPAVLFSAREMALTHIDQDLRRSLIKNGPGTDVDWNRVGGFVAQAEREHFFWHERQISKLLGTVDSSFNVAKFRDEMRDEVIRNHFSP